VQAFEKQGNMMKKTGEKHLKTRKNALKNPYFASKTESAQTALAARKGVGEKWLR